MKLSSPLKMLLRVIEYHGLEYETADGKHAKVYILHNGHRRLIVASQTPSDRRGILNKFTELKRVFAELGVEFKSDSRELIHN